MNSHINCPQCNLLLVATESQFNKKVACPQCNHQFIPLSEEINEAEEILRSLKSGWRIILDIFLYFCPFLILPVVGWIAYIIILRYFYLSRKEVLQDRLEGCKPEAVAAALKNIQIEEEKIRREIAVAETLKEKRAEYIKNDICPDCLVKCTWLYAAKNGNRDYRYKTNHLSCPSCKATLISFNDDEDKPRRKRSYDN